MKALLSLLLSVSALAQLCAAADVNLPANEAPANNPLRIARVVRMRDDSKASYLTVFGQTGDAEYRSILDSFQRHPQLIDFKRTVHFHAIATDDPAYGMYARSVKQLPCIRLQRADGEVLYEACGRTLPKSATQLAEHLLDPCSCFCQLKKIFRTDGGNGLCRARQADNPPPVVNVQTGESEAPKFEAPVEHQHPLADLLTLAGVVAATATVGGCVFRFAHYVQTSKQ